jgi:hypothetical protein
LARTNRRPFENIGTELRIASKITVSGTIIYYQTRRAMSPTGTKPTCRDVWLRSAMSSIPDMLSSP